MLNSKQPRPLYTFFATEMWERYGFYVIQSLLALYLSLDFGFADEKTYALVGSFTALTYVSPIVGGWIADKLIGQKISIILGCIILMMSYFMLWFDDTLFGLYFCLASVSIGTGLLKPNISSLVGNLYSQNDARRDSGFTIFYMGITAGIILGTTLPSQLVDSYGWSMGFASAGFGLALALIIFSLGVKRYRIEDYTLLPPLNFSKCFLGVGIVFFYWFTAFNLLKHKELSGIVFSLVAIASFIYIIFAAKTEDREQAKKTISILLLCVISILFWTFYFQMFSSLTLFINRLVTPTVFGFRFSPPYYVTIQSVGMLFFGYFFAKAWQYKKPENVAYATAYKFFLAMCFMLMAYCLIDLSIAYSELNSLIFPIFIIVSYLMISVAELLLSPTGLSAITQLAKPSRMSTMMGIFFISLGVGGYLSGMLAQFTTVSNTDTSIYLLKQEYAQGFKLLTYLLAFSTILTGLIVLIIKKQSKKSPSTSTTTLPKNTLLELN